MNAPAPGHRALGAAALMLVLSSCQALQDVAKSLDLNRPTAEITSASLSDLSLDGVTVLMDVAVTNTYGVDLPLAGLDYGVDIQGRPVVSGVVPAMSTLKSGVTETIKVPARLDFMHVLDMVSGLSAGDVVPWSASVDVRVDAPGVGPIALPLKTSGELPVPAVPRLSMPSIEWDELSFTEAKATVRLDVFNTNSFPLELDPSDLSLSLAGTRVASANVNAGRLDGQGTTSLEVPISFKPSDLGLALLSVLQGSAADYALTGRLAADTPFGALDFPVDAVGQTSLLR